MTDEGFPQGLTRRQHDIISVVRFRNSDPDGSPVWVVPHGTDLTDLYVPAMYGRTTEGPLHERLWTVRRSTVKACADSGAISVGPARSTAGLRGLPPDTICCPVIPDWDWVERRGAPLGVTDD